MNIIENLNNNKMNIIENLNNNKIFIQIASYRDVELPMTIKDCIENASNPDNLTFGICWQHGDDEDLSLILYCNCVLGIICVASVFDVSSSEDFIMCESCKVSHIHKDCLNYIENSKDKLTQIIRSNSKRCRTCVHNVVNTR